MKQLPCRLLITDTKTTDPVAAAKRLPKNSGIILRDYDLSENERFVLGQVLKKIATQRRLVFIVAKDVELAIRLKADGVHFPEYMHNEIRKWRLRRNRWIITAAAHSRAAAKHAGDNGADAILLSTLFETSSHPEKKGLGIHRAIKYIYKAVPAYGLGGVKPRHEKLLKTGGFQGFAGISWVKNCVS